MKKFRVLPQICCQLFLVLAIGIPAFAQSNKGTIVGTVKDPNDALVNGAKITAINLATGEVREASSGDDGTYTVSNLEPGSYRVSADAQGFQTVVFELVAVETSSRVPLDVKFSTVTGGTGTVTISADAVPLVESETSVRGDLITGRQVTDLPIPQRNFTLLATLSPGVTRPVVGVVGGGGNFEGGSPVGNSTESTRFRESGGSVLAVNGARPTNNNFTVDGVDNNEGQFAQIGIYPPPDSIAEFKIETSAYPAESGRAGGAVISTTIKSGGNEVHGAVYENYQGRFASAIGRNEVPSRLPNRTTHQFGGVVSGPLFLPRFGEGGSSIWDGRNQSFWLFYMERQRNSTPAFGGGEFPFVTVPTARMRVGDFGELLQPGTSRNYRLANGTTISAPRGTVFCANMLPAPSNDIRNCGQPLSQSALNTLQAYPLPTESGIENNFRRNRKEKYNRDGWGLKFDHKITSNNTMFFAYSEDESVRVRDNNFPLGTSPNNNDLPSGFGAGDEFGDSRGVRLGDTHLFSPTVINDFRVGAIRVEIGINNPGINGALGFNPNVSANLGHQNVNICAQCEGVVLLGVEELLNGNRDGGQLEFIGDGGPFYFTSNNFSFADGLTIVRGTHSLKFGGDYRLRQNSNFDGGRNGGMKGNVQYGTSASGFLAGNFGNIGIGPSDSGSGIANLLFGYPPAFITRGTPGGPNFQSNKELAFFAQDDWKVNPELTLNLGLRWDLFTQPTERFDRQTNYNPANDTLTRAGENAPGGRDLVNSDKNNFGPRIGFSWSGLKNDRTLVIRGAYGLMYAVDIPGIPGILSTNPPGGANYACNIQQYGTATCPQLPARFNFDTGYAFPQEIIGIQPGQTFAAPVGTSLVFVDPDISNEMFHQYNLTAQWEFRSNWLAELGYVASRGRNLLVLENIGNQGAGGFPGSRQVTTHGTVQTITYTGKSWYDSLQTKVEKRYSQGLSIMASYVWSKAMDNSPGAFCIGGTGPRSCGFANPLRPELDKALSDLDTPHRFNFASTWELPFGRGRRYWSDISPGLNAILGGWQLNNNITIQSGPPFSIFRFGVRADIVPAGSTCPEIAGQGTTTARTFQGLTFCPARTRVFSSDPELDPSEENPNRLANVPRFGNVGRNAFRGARQEFWDAGLFKNIFIPAISEQFNVQLRIQAYNVLNHVNGFRPRNDLGDSLFGIDTNEQRRRQLEFGIKIIF